MKHFICCLYLLLLGDVVARAAYPQVRTQASPDGQRYLFIIDTSSRMDDLQSANEASLYDLLRSGIGGHMRPGDTYGIWTFNQETKTSFPMQVWDFKRAVQLGTIAAAYINQEHYERSSNLKAAMADLLNVVHSVSNLTAFIISDGNSDMKGTPFDKTINEEYRKQRRNRKQAKRPFVTTLIVRDGWFVQSQVTVSGQPIILPPRPEPGSVRNDPPRLGSATNPPPKAVAKAEPASAVGKDSSASHPAHEVPPAGTAPIPASTKSEAAARVAPNNLADSPGPTSTTNVESPKPPKIIQIVTKPPSVAIPVVESNAPAPNADTTRLQAAEAAGSNVIASIVTPPGPATSPPASLANAPTSSAVTGSGGRAREGVVPTPNPTVISSSVVETVPTSAPVSAGQAASTSPWNGLKNVLSPPPLPVAAREAAPALGGVSNAVETERSSSLAAQPVMAMPVAPSRTIQMVMIGLGTSSLLLGLGLAAVLLRRRRGTSHGSIITQSMERR